MEDFIKQLETFLIDIGFKKVDNKDYIESFEKKSKQVTSQMIINNQVHQEESNILTTISFSEGTIKDMATLKIDPILFVYFNRTNLDNKQIILEHEESFYSEQFEILKNIIEQNFK